MTASTAETRQATPTPGGDPAGRILIADDHRMITEAVARLLERTGGFETTVVGSLPEAIQTLTDDPGYDLLLLDVRMPGMNGLESVQRVLSRAGETKVVLFSGEADRRFVAGAVELGVRGLIPKTMPLKALTSALQLVLSGEVFMPVEGAATAGAMDAADAGLTQLETTILRLASDGHTNKEIALHVNLGEVAVKMHMRAICRKLDARNRTHAAMMARSLGII
jgi:two-component system nitrate/nitrite response regulator NarP